MTTDIVRKKRKYRRAIFSMKKRFLIYNGQKCLLVFVPSDNILDPNNIFTRSTYLGVLKLVHLSKNFILKNEIHHLNFNYDMLYNLPINAVDANDYINQTVDWFITTVIPYIENIADKIEITEKCQQIKEKKKNESSDSSYSIRSSTTVEWLFKLFGKSKRKRIRIRTV